MMICTKCHKPLPKKGYSRTKRGPHHQNCQPSFSDRRRLDYLENLQRRDDAHGARCGSFLVLTLEGHTCWGKTYRDAIDYAMRRDGLVP